MKILGYSSYILFKTDIYYKECFPKLSKFVNIEFSETFNT